MSRRLLSISTIFRLLAPLFSRRRFACYGATFSHTAGPRGPSAIRENVAREGRGQGADNIKTKRKREHKRKGTRRNKKEKLWHEENKKQNEHENGGDSNFVGQRRKMSSNTTPCNNTWCARWQGEPRPVTWPHRSSHLGQLLPPCPASKQR